MSSPDPYYDVVEKLQGAEFGYPIWLPNEPFTVPKPPRPWIRVSITSDVLQPIELGADVWQEEGTAYVEVVVPAFTGTRIARALAKNIANLFRGLDPAPVVYLGTSIGDGVVQPVDGLWWGLTVAIDWRYQDIDPHGYTTNESGIVTTDLGDPVELS